MGVVAIVRRSIAVSLSPRLAHDTRGAGKPLVPAPVLGRERQSAPPVRVFRHGARQVRLVLDVQNILDLQGDEAGVHLREKLLQSLGVRAAEQAVETRGPLDAL